MTVTLTRWSEGDLPLLERMNAPEMTAYLSGREHQGKGVAGAALRALIGHVRSDGRRGLLVAYPGIDNPASNALCARAGFQAQGEGTEPWRGGELTFRIWVLDMAALRTSGTLEEERFDGDDPDRW